MSFRKIELLGNKDKVESINLKNATTGNEEKYIYAEEINQMKNMYNSLLDELEAKGLATKDTNGNYTLNQVEKDNATITVHYVDGSSEVLHVRK